MCKVVPSFIFYLFIYFFDVLTVCWQCDFQVQPETKTTKPYKHPTRKDLRTGSVSNTTLSYKVNSTSTTCVLNLTSNEKKIPEIRAKGALRVSLPGQLVWEEWVIAGREWVIKGRTRTKIHRNPSRQIYGMQSAAPPTSSYG